VCVCVSPLRITIAELAKSDFDNIRINIIYCFIGKAKRKKR
jgi:hypothetical protein